MAQHAGQGAQGRVATVRDVADRAGVSQATAARALGGYGSVSGAARTRVLDAAAALGYQPNDVARALASGASRTVGLIVGDFENPFFATAARGLSDVVEGEGYTLLLANSDESLERERRAIQAFRARSVDALVICPVSDQSSVDLRGLGFPIVLLDRVVRGLERDAVTVGNAAGATRAVQHLIDLGHQRIGAVTDTSAIHSTAQRLRGYRSALRSAGLPTDDDLVSVGNSSQEGGYQAALALLQGPDRPDGIFATSNFMTAGTVRALRELGLRIGSDVALVGFDDTDWAELTDPPITVVRQPVMEMGRRAGELLLQRLRDPDAPPQRARLATDLVVRRSAGEPAAAVGTVA
jgi:LacI family transcriptional regulator